MLPYTQQAPYHSQWGEDRWLTEHLLLPTAGVFVDVGTGDGVRGSNTLYLERIGWTGLCIDADPRNHHQLRQRNCTIETCAVASVPGRRPFGMYGPTPSWSGLLREGPDYIPITVECRPLEDLLSRAGIRHIDVLSIDVEGTELDVWESFDQRLHHTTIVIIEYDDDHTERSANHIQARLGDSHRLVHRTPANLLLSAIEPPSSR